MARGRHRRRSGLLSRLPGLRWPQRRRSRTAVLEAEVVRLRGLADASAAAAGAALLRAAAAEESALLAQQRSLRAVAELACTRDHVVGLRADLAALREELVWAFAEGRLPVAAPTVIDVRDEASRTA